MTTAHSDSPLSRQVGGSHYQTDGIQPIEFIERNGFPFSLGCAIKYVARWRKKGGVQDLEKAIHYLEFAIEFGAQAPVLMVPPQKFFTSNQMNEEDSEIIWHICVEQYDDAIIDLNSLIAAERSREINA
jgi:hypothetical protein